MFGFLGCSSNAAKDSRLGKSLPDMFTPSSDKEYAAFDRHTFLLWREAVNPALGHNRALDGADVAHRGPGGLNGFTSISPARRRIV